MADELKKLFEEFSTPVSMRDGIERRAMTAETFIMVYKLAKKEEDELRMLAIEEEHRRIGYINESRYF